MIKITEAELVELFAKWYSEHESNPDEFEEYNNPEDAAKTFKEYLKEIRELKTA